MQRVHNIKEEKASCGFGLMAQMDNKPSHWLLETAIYSLSRLSHRGAIAPDGKTGDGCGILMKKPDAFLRTLANEAGIKLSPLYAAGSIFLSQDKLLAANAIARLEKELHQEKLELVWQRSLPINAEACGENALQSIPQFVQIFINAPEAMDEQSFERHLYKARRRSELALEAKDPTFYIASLSCRMLSYKGMIMPHNLSEFFLDLKDPRLETSLCLYHQRFSTNTFPRWSLAQPFRLLAHNGEINTIRGNRNWSISRESKYSTPLIENIQELLPLVSKHGSDSMSLDNMLEGLLMTGVDLLQAVKILIPPAWQNSKLIDPDLKAFYEYYSLHMDPWDGPAALVISDGRYAACSLDRNGLRPARYLITKDRHLTVASEIGVYDYDPNEVVSKGRLKPGEMIALDMTTGKLLLPPDVDHEITKKNPYKQWLGEYAHYLIPVPEEERPGCDAFFPHELQIYEKQFGLTLEEREHVLGAIANTGQELTASMGDDTPIPVLSQDTRSLYEYFRQQFAQVTNPPIDPIREKAVMSLNTCLGKEVNPFIAVPENAIRIDIGAPILSKYTFKSLIQPDDINFAYERIDLTYPKESDLVTALNKICDQAERAVRNGKVILVLSDRGIRRKRIPIHALLGTGAVNARLCQKGLRCDANLIIETATARDPHHFAALIGFGATAVYPYLAYQVLYDMAQHHEINCPDTVELMQTYREAIRKGLYKILSKMGISTINSYRGAQLFEAIGLHEEVIELCFPGTISRIQGATFKDLEKDQRILADQAWNSNKSINPGGLMKYNPYGEYHAFNPDVVTTLQAATRTGDFQEYKKFTDLVNKRPIMALRDMLQLKPNKNSINIDRVESIEKIFPRFCSAAMSIGAISPEAHEALAIAMNQIGAYSNSGEGGEDPARYGTNKSSRIKQVASARFGVTPGYLVNADVLQIKIAQGAKPGEGGQLASSKVDAYIAKLRHTRAGTTLISPPPHHDIYSIEDLAQLIFDLKQINPSAEVSVKLVAESGVGTVAAGVAKTYADSITIAGHDGGTGASPITSIRYAGIPWELGLTEAHQILRANNLRDKVRLQVDGGLKTGLDVIKAAILGAESFGFGTAPLVALGCKYLRICHLNNCATGIATQNPILREKHFKGLPEMLVHYFSFVAMEIREWLAYLGAEKLTDIIGRTELLEIISGETEKQKHLSLEILLSEPKEAQGKAQYCQQHRNTPYDKALLAERMVQDTLPCIVNQAGGVFEYAIKNINRSIGARVSGEIAKLYGDAGLKNNPLVFKFKGVAGQSFGAWNINGLHLILEGDANDYVGKGMGGGKIVVYPPQASEFISRNTPILGNTCLYGATGGKLFASGQAAERFAVRNSGAVAVIEGSGDHCCEYMTNGVVVILGKTGINFGAGMTGGLAFVLDEENELINKYNDETVEIVNLDSKEMQDYQAYLRHLIEEFVAETQSKWGIEVLKNFSGKLNQFRLVRAKGSTLSGGELLADVQKQLSFVGDRS